MLGIGIFAMIIVLAILVLSLGSRVHPYQAGVVHAPISVQPEEAPPERDGRGLPRER
jgi:hypothetical protein